MNTVLLVLGGVLLVVYVGGPILIRFRHTMTLPKRFEPVEPEALPRETYAFFGETARGLQECGFSLAAILRHLESSSAVDMTSYIAFWINRAAGQGATAVTIQARPKNGPAKNQRYVEFATYIAGDLEINTSNCAQMPSFKPAPGMNTLHAAAVTDVVKLYHLHLRREATLGTPTAARYLPSPGHDVKWFSDTCDISVLRQVELGYLHAGSQPGTYRPTWTGAFMMTWGLLPPMKQIRAARMRRRAQKAIEQAEAPPLSPPRVTVITQESPYTHELRELLGDPPAPDPLASQPDAFPGQDRAAAATIQPNGPGVQRRCPECEATIPFDAVRCFACGTPVEPGQELEEGRRQPSEEAAGGGPGRFVLGIILSAAAAAVGAVTWAVVAIITGYELGLIAAGVGGLAGLGMFLGYRRKSVMAGVVAVGTSTVAILAAKVAIFIFVIYAVTTGSTGNNIGLQRMFIVDRMASEILDERVMPADTDREEIWKEARQRVDAMSDEAVRRKAEEYRTAGGTWDAEGAPDEDGDRARRWLAMRLARRRTVEEGVPDDDDRRKAFYEQELGRCLEMSEEQVEAENAKLDAQDEREWKRQRLAGHFGDRRAEAEGLAYDDDRREVLYEQELARCNKMSEDEIDAGIAKLEAWEEGGKWSDPDYVRDFLVYAAIDRQTMEENADVEIGPDRWQRLYESAKAEVDAIPVKERASRVKEVEAERERQAEEAMRELDELMEASRRDAQREVAGRAGEAFISTLSAHDLVWILFAVWVAYKVGAGRWGKLGTG